MGAQRLKQIRQEIRLKKRMDLADYFGVVHLTKRYYDAMQNTTAFPVKELPDLQYLVDAHTVVKKYLEHAPQGISLNLCRAMLNQKQIVAVWLFYNTESQCITLGQNTLTIKSISNELSRS